MTINEYHTFSPTLTNELRIGLQPLYAELQLGNSSYPGLDSFPNLLLLDLNQLQVGPDETLPQSANQNTYQATEAMTWTKGQHTLKFGVEVASIAPQTFTQRVRGDYEYNDTLTFLQDGVPDSLAERSNGDPVYYGDRRRFTLTSTTTGRSGATSR